MPVISAGVLPDEFLSLLTPGQPTVAIAPSCRGGLILIGRFFNDLLLPGAGLVMVTSFQLLSVQVIGEVEICPVADLAGTISAKYHRLAGMEQLQEILQQPDSALRAYQLVSLLCDRIGLAAARPIPAVQLAPLVAVEPGQMTQAWQAYEQTLAPPPLHDDLTPPPLQTPWRPSALNPLLNPLGQFMPFSRVTSWHSL